MIRKLKVVKVVIGKAVLGLAAGHVRKLQVRLHIHTSKVFVGSGLEVGPRAPCLKFVGNRYVKNRKSRKCENLQNGHVVIEKPKKGTSENFEIRTIWRLAFVTLTAERPNQKSFPRVPRGVHTHAPRRGRSHSLHFGIWWTLRTAQCRWRPRCNRSCCHGCHSWGSWSCTWIGKFLT